MHLLTSLNFAKVGQNKKRTCFILALEIQKQAIVGSSSKRSLVGS
jgi:hypothetical protein